MVVVGDEVMLEVTEVVNVDVPVVVMEKVGVVV